MSVSVVVETITVREGTRRERSRTISAARSRR